MSSKKLINESSKVVNESLLGLVISNPNLCLLEGHQVVLRNDLSNLKGKVAIISGGGSGHEPAHVGYVGQGMLSGAVCGPVFTSPPVSSILATLNAIYHEGSPSGIIMVVKNYTGDRINFGLALERAANLGITCPIEMVVISDDCALTSQDKSAGRRGLAGTVLVHKISGHLADQGCSLKDIVLYLKKHVIDNIGTIGLCLSPCTLPGRSVPSFELKPDEMELGLGIHGESGVKRMKIESASESVRIMLDHMEKSCANFQVNNSEFAILINNLGGTSNLEIGLVANEVIKELKRRNSNVLRSYVGTFMTSLEMAGISITLCRVNSNILNCLDSSVTALGWPNINYQENVHHLSAKNLRLTFQDDLNLPNKESQAVLSPFGMEIAKKSINFACEALISCETMLNTMDSGSGDGDCGSTLRRGAEQIITVTQQLEWKTLDDLFQIISKVCENDMGGTTGAMYSILFASALENIKTQQVTIRSIFKALQVGLSSVMKYGGAELGDRTMIDSLYPALYKHSFEEEIMKPLNFFEKATIEAEQGAISTLSIKKAKSGRASYVSSDKLKHPDPGAHAVGIIFRAIYQASLLKCREFGYKE